MPVLLAEAELRQEARSVVDVGLAREHVVVRVARHDDRLVHVDRAVAARLVVAEAVRCPGSWKKPGSKIVCCGVRLPDVSAASARNGLIVEPGG